MKNGLGFRIWGARGSLPRLSRGQLASGGNTVCIEVLHPGDDWIVLDAGTGIANLGDHILAAHEKLPIHLFLSHYHWDHVMGLPFFGPIYRPGYAINIYGLRSEDGHVQEMLDVVFSPFYSPIYSPDNLLGSIRAKAAASEQRIDGIAVKTTALADIHPGGYMVTRVEDSSRCFVYASDVELRTPDAISSLAACAQNADLLLCDASFSHRRFETAVGWGHSSLEAGYEVARQAGVKRLMGIHYDPLRTDDDLEATRDALQSKSDGISVELAREGETVWL